LKVTFTPTLILGRKRWKFLGKLGDLRLLLIREARGADDHAHAQIGRHGQVLHRAFGAREVDQAVGLRQGCAHIAFDLQPAGLAQECRRIGADGRAVGAVQCRSQHAVAAVQNRFDQHMAHAAGGTRHSNALRGGGMGGGCGHGAITRSNERRQDRIHAVIKRASTAFCKRGTTCSDA
jgi:hypothetical protein